jgi:DNA (cytosine-5)-methyltransferase 1
MFTFGSLFAGIGGIDLGLERAGFRCRWQVEIDPFCRRVLEKHWPTVEKHKDITELDFDALEKVDLLAGGFPCQDLSLAGKRKGIYGVKSGLWSEFYRCICAIRPRAVFVENVPGLLISGLGRVFGDLAASGYNAQWDCLSAAAVGAPHIRDRVFVTAYRSDTDKNRKSTHPIYDKEAQRVPSFCASGKIPNADRQPLRELRKRKRKQQRKPGTAKSGIFGNDWADRIAGFEAWKAGPPVCRMANGLSHRMDRNRALGNAVVPQCAELVGRGIFENLLGGEK